VTTLSFTGKRWTLPGDTFAGGCDALCALIAGRRMIAEDAAGFPRPTVFPDAAKAAARIERAAPAGEKVAVFGDYDCDGITSSAMLIRALRRRGVEPLAILPHRARHGYGLKDWVIDQCADEGVSLLLVVDNGILSASSIQRGNARGIDTIVMDHHHAPPSPPPAHAILHPALCDFPEPHPSAAGVVFLFLLELEQGGWDGYEEDLALATIGTVADLVALKGYNRTLVRMGIEAMRRGGIGRIGMLIEACGCGDRITSGDIAFRVAPRINAAGRMDDPMIALRAVLDGGADLARLEELNADRQRRTLECLDALKGDAPDAALPEPPAFLFHAADSFPPGIIGLLAGKLTEHWGRPSLVASVQGDHCTASLRSTSAYHVTEALNRHARLLTTHGGHAQAAGCTFPLSALEELKAALQADAAERIRPDELRPTLTLDAELTAEHVALPLAKGIRRLEPFGQGNPDPLFLLRGAKLENARVVGTDGRHLQATIGGRKMIAFGLGEFAGETHRPLDLAFTLGVDAWNGIERPQLVVRDMRAAGAR
jgi:single-stranded-DNA-specific exonuclease